MFKFSFHLIFSQTCIVLSCVRRTIELLTASRAARGAQWHASPYRLRSRPAWKRLHFHTLAHYWA